jgi:radical SAM/Cys-rich protein
MSSPTDDVPANDNHNSKGALDANAVALEAARARWRRRDLFGQTLVTETLEDLKSRGTATLDPPSPGALSSSSTASTAASGKVVSKEERAQQRRDLHHLNVPSFSSVLATNGLALKRKSPTILQVNIGLYCNQACSHCHVESSPLRVEETMSVAVVERCLKLLRETPSLTTLDITGGAPELNRNFRMLVALARQLRPDLEIIDRCNLTVLLEPGQEDLVDFLKAHTVRIVASLPCYSSENVDKQRGRGVFDRSIAALLALNAAGYGTNPDLPLDLVYNPVGPFLPPDQSQLQVQYKDELRRNFGILFDSLFTITNMPIKRFADSLHRAQQLQSYMDLLVSSFNPDAVERVMCVDTISVDYRGNLYDCDFNQQLGMPILGATKSAVVDGAGGTTNDDDQGGSGGPRGLTVFDVSNLEELSSRPIRTDRHCFGCTAGMGSSCQGATTALSP